MEFYAFPASKELQGLREPKFILMPPVGIQYGFLSIALGLSLAGAGWFLHSLLGSGTISGVQLFCGILSVLGLATTLRARNWRRWASFACDRNGIYLPKSSLPTYTFKPWDDVAGAYIGRVSSHDDVIFKVRFSKEEWYRHVGHDWDFPVREDGYLHIETGQQCRDLNDTLKSIEKVRSVSGTVSDFQLGPRPEEVVPPTKLNNVLTALFLTVFCSGFLFPWLHG